MTEHEGKPLHDSSDEYTRRIMANYTADELAKMKPKSEEEKLAELESYPEIKREDMPKPSHGLTEFIDSTGQRWEVYYTMDNITTEILGYFKVRKG